MVDNKAEEKRLLRAKQAAKEEEKVRKEKLEKANESGRGSWFYGFGSGYDGDFNEGQETGSSSGYGGGFDGDFCGGFYGDFDGGYGSNY